MNIEKYPHLQLIVSVTLAVILCSCATYDPVNVEEDFGNSVRNMIDQQTIKPTPVQDKAAANQGLDGNSAANSMSTYRKGQKQSGKKPGTDQLKLGN